MAINFKLVISLLIILPFTFAALNGKCSGRSGICISTTSCSKYKGTSFSGYCPNDSNDIRCCDSIGCTASGKSGKCMFESQCTGTTYSGLCPGGNDFKCCVEGPGETGGSTGDSTSKSVTQLVTSLLKYEEGTHRNGICYAYKDSLGYPTIGYGKLCEHVVVSSDAQAKPYCDKLGTCSAQKAEKWLQDEISSKTSCVLTNSNIKAAYNKASNYRKAIIISMAYQLGCAGLAGFKQTLSYMANGNWASAATAMVDSNWYRQTPNRANRHAHVIRNNNCGNFCGDYGW
jgi:GH24 family phage-related lysozyme (muramidase)